MVVGGSVEVRREYVLVGKGLVGCGKGVYRGMCA